MCSSDLLNVKSLFYNKNISVFVEGKEDILFWDKVFQPFNEYSYHIEDTNGIEGLEEHINRIINDNAQIIVACDCDHSLFLKNDKKKHPLIIKTYGYSIENSMYCIHNINNAIKRYSKTRKDFKNEIIGWYNEFCNDCSIMLYYDIANMRFTKKTKVFGDKCNRFLINDNHINISKSKVSQYIKSIESKFEEKEINECISLVKKDKRELRFLIKGHFLTNAVLNYIKNAVRNETGLNVTISLESFYSLLINCILSCSSKCDDLNELNNRVKYSLEYLDKLKPSA